MKKTKHHSHELAQIAVDAYVDAVESGGQSLAENIVDLMVDLRHLTDARAIDWDECLVTASQHHRAESGDGFDAWTDHATYAVSRYVMKTASVYQYWKAQLKTIQKVVPELEQVKSETWTESQAVRYRLADQMAEKIREETPIKNDSIYSDLLGSAFDEVDWVHVADDFLKSNNQE